MSQTSYTRARAVAVPGLPADSGDRDVVSYPANEDIEPGRLVVLRSDGKLEVPNQTTLGTKVVGVTMFRPTSESAVGGGSGVYKAGEMVSVMRKGRIWAQHTGGAQAEMATINVHHSSTIATNRGKFTNTATSAGAGVEITACPEGVQCHKTGPTGLVQVALNLPA